MNGGEGKELERVNEGGSEGEPDLSLVAPDIQYLPPICPNDPMRISYHFHGPNKQRAHFHHKRGIERASLLKSNFPTTSLSKEIKRIKIPLLSSPPKSPC